MIKAVLVRGLVAVTMIAGAGWLHAQSGTTYRCVGEQGRSTYTNIKQEMAGKKCTPVSREVSIVPAQAQPKGAPAATGGSASSHANERRKILEQELVEEEKRLSEARDKLAEQESMRGGDERNYQRVLDRLKPYADSVEQHEQKLEQLKRELNTTR